ncbi:MAG: adenylyl-sulfate kinase [Bacteroidales bacterium]|nr:adenylyl-sulfate kinase [Bacteroidales bacterium]
MKTESSYNNVTDLADPVRMAKENLLQQRARVIWMCGLSGAGKSTLAGLLDDELARRGYLSRVIDGDVVRSGLNKGLGYSVEDRHENLRRVAEVAKLFAGCGVIAIVSFISPTRYIRNLAREIVGENDFLQVFVDAPLEVCEHRDTKGLYKQAREGKIKDFTGIDSPFEPPVQADLIIDTAKHSVDESSKQLLEFVLPKIELNQEPRTKNQEPRTKNQHPAPAKY